MPPGLQRVFGQLRQRVTILLGALALLAFTPLAVSQSARARLDGSARRIDEVGSLRTGLMQLAFASATGAPQGEVERLGASQLRTIERLVQGDEELPACSPRETCRRLRGHARRLRDEILPAARAGEELGALVRSEHAEIDDTVHRMAEATEQDMAALETQGALATVGAALLVALVAYAVWDVFARVRAVRDATEADDAETRLAGLAAGSDELAAVARSIRASLGDLRRAGEAERQRVEQLLSAVPDAVLVVGRDGHIEYANDQVAEAFGWSPEELVGELIERLVPEKHRGGHAAHRASFARAPTTRAMGASQDLSALRKDGTSFFADISLGPVEIDGEAMVVAAVRDVSERHEARQRLEELGARLARANGELEARNAELEQFAFAASHDMQEPLRKIIAFGDRLERSYGDALGERGLDYLARMRSASSRMQLLIEDLLRWSRLTTRAEPYAKVDLGLTVREALEDLEVAIEKARATVRVGELPTVDADATQMRQLFQNLIANAIKYRKDDRDPVIEITAAVDDEHCRVTVADNGIGFEQKYAERIFDVFERLHGRTEYEGTGIGLALCRKIARRHGGEITATSAPDVGTAFTIVLPVRQDLTTASAA